MSAKTDSMGSMGGVKSDVKRAGQKVEFSPVMEALTRVGYGVRGLIYIVMGLLALQVVLGKGSAAISQQSAIAAIGRQPGGMILLWVILVGLVSYSLWGVVRAIMDPLHKGHDLKGLAVRAGYLFSAASYAILILPTYAYIKGAGSVAQGGAQQSTMAKLMATSWGHIGIGIIGLAVIGVGIQQIIAGFNASFDRQFKTYAMTAQELRIATQLGRFGTATRGFILALLGVLVTLAAYQSNPNQPVGIGAAFTALLSQPYGIWLLGIVGFGLIAFGLYSMLSAAWFRMKR